MITLDEKKRALNVTWDDPDTNAKIDDCFTSAEFHIWDYAGVNDIDPDEDRMARQLIKDCARYIWNDVFDEFERRYQTHLIALRTKYQVLDFEEEEEEDMKTDYLGHLDNIFDMSTTAKKGQYYIADSGLSLFFPEVHQNDQILCEKDDPERLIDGINWSLLHNEPDTDTTYDMADAQDIHDIFNL